MEVSGKIINNYSVTSYQPMSLENYLLAVAARMTDDRQAHRRKFRKAVRDHARR